MKDVVILVSGEELSLIEELIVKNELPYDLINTLSLNPLDAEISEELISSEKKIYVYGHKLDVLLLKYFNSRGSSDRLIFVDADGVDKLFTRIEKEKC